MIQDTDIKKLKLLDRNPRKISSQQLKKLCDSLTEDPEFLHKRPVLVNLTDGSYQVYAGNQRVRAAKKLGWKTIPCDIEENVDPQLMKSRVIKDNKAMGEWDFEILAKDWDADKLLDWGFEEVDLAHVGIETIEPGEEDEDATSLEPPKDEDAVTKPGDVYELISGIGTGIHHRVFCGDSTIPDSVSSCLNGAEPILMVTDPPYGVDYDPGWRDAAGKGCRAKGKVQNDDKVNWALAWHLFPGSVAYIWSGDKFIYESLKSIKDNDFEIINQIVWSKQHFALSRGDYHSKHESCLYAIKKGHNHNWQGARDQSTVWEIANLNAFGKSKEEGEDRTAHSTQKPIECMARPIRNNTAKGEGVYDPFLGSGTTLIAAEMLGRQCFGIELSPAYVDICVTRWVKYMTKNNLDHTIKKNDEVINWQHQVYRGRLINR